MRLGLRALPPLTPAPLPGVPGEGSEESLCASSYRQSSGARNLYARAPFGGVLERGIFMRSSYRKRTGARDSLSPAPIERALGQGILFREPIQFAYCGSFG